MSTAALALLAAVAAVILATVVATMVLRSRRASEQMLDEGLLAIGERMDALVRELEATVARMREDALRTRLVESLGQALDLEEVIARCADAAAALHGVAGATVSVTVNGEPLTAASGLAVGEPGRRDVGTIGGPPDGSAVRAVGISYHYPAEGPVETAIRSAIAVPLTNDHGPLGFLTVYGLGEDPPVRGSDFQVLESIASHTVAAIDVACQRHVAAPELGRDLLTGLGNRQALHETLALEVARAHRRGHRLAVCSFDVDDFRRTNARIGNLEGDAILVAVAEALHETLRPTDLAYRSGGDEFAAILPHAGRIEGEALYARVQATLRRQPDSPTPAVSLSAGIAELKPDDDGVSLFERSERALQRAKQTGKGTAA
jgi:diguanylate cyclase (GGDEF)-like protein